VASATEDIAPTCPCEDPTPGIGTVVEAAYATLVDQHMVPLEGIEDRMLDLLPWDGLPPVGHPGQLSDAHVALLLSSEYPPSTASCPFPALEETLDASLLVDHSKQPPDMCTCSIEYQKFA
jgi:hypothetical protein